MPKTLQEELQQTRPFDGIEEEVHLSVLRTYAVLDRHFGRLLKPYGLTPTQYNVLRILRGAGEEGLCRNEVGARLISEVPDVTRLLDRMKRARLIRRQRSLSDRRMVRTLIARKGLDLLDEIDPQIRQAHRERLAHVSADRLRALADLLAEVRDAGP